MKCLFVCPASPDHLAICLWDGLQEVLGEDNVFDAGNCPWLHGKPNDQLGYESAVSRKGRWLGSEGPFDLLVIAATFNREHDWAWAKAWLELLKPDGKVAYLEGWDAAWQIHPPEMRVDAVFRKEISRSVSYPYNPCHLSFAAPQRWFDQENNVRPYDVSFIGNPETCHPDNPDLRWQTLSKTFQTRRKHRCVIATKTMGIDLYASVLRKSKLALCPAAADGADSLRTYEAVACGAVPIFVGYPDYARDPWFPNELCFNCVPESLPEHIDEALSHDLTGKRHALVEYAKKWHTTRARAEKVLGVLWPT